MIKLINPLPPRMNEAQRIFSQAIEAGYLTNFGVVHGKLEAKLDHLSGGYCMPMSTGTAAIEIGLAMLGLKPGDRVMLPDFTHSGTILAIVRAGLKPVLARVDPLTWVLSLDDAEELFAAGEIEAAVVVSPFGYSVDFCAWETLQARTGIGLVYDFAGKFGFFPATMNPICYSFHATKNFGVGEGGMILFQSAEHREHARRLINFDTLPNRDIASLSGGNYKIDELKAAYLLAGLMPSAFHDVIHRIGNKRRALEYYRQNIPGSYLPLGTKHPSLCVLGNLPAKELEAASDREQIVFRKYYPLLSRMKALANVETHSISEEAMEYCCALPSDVDMSQAKRVVEVVKRYL